MVCQGLALYEAHKGLVSPGEGVYKGGVAPGALAKDRDRFMVLRLAALLSVLGLSALWASSAFAIGEDVFVVPRVTVQAEANSATAAKDAAQTQGRRRAMDILLRRLTVEDDWPYLPRIVDPQATAETAPDNAGVAGLDPASPVLPDFEPGFADVDAPRIITLTDRDLEELESGFEVYNEKSSSRTYRAFITYRFKPAAVRRLLRDAQIPYSEAQTRTALVLPVLQTQQDIYLWEENNPWMAAWKVRPYNNELTPMIAPLGDVEDSGAITARQALNLDAEALQIMAERYSVSQVIVAHAYLRQVDGEDRLRVRLINGFRESGEIGGLEEFNTPEEDDGAAFGAFGPANNDFMLARAGDVLAEARFNRPSGNFPALAEAAIETAIAKHATPWKRQTLIDHTEAALLEASAYFASIGEWAQIRSALVSTPLIGSIQVRSMSRLGAEMLIRSYGDPGKLIVAMEAQGLALWTEDGGERWRIATPVTAQGVRNQNDRRDRRRRGDRFGPDASEDESASVPFEPSY